MNPKVSVVMSVHNGAEFLHASMFSILGQSFDDFEFIVVDDASTDNSVELIESFDDSRIRLLRNQANLGLTRSLNLGMRVARGVFIARMDHDDVSKPHRLATQIAFLEENPDIGLVGSAVEAIGESGGVIGLIKKPENHDQIVLHLAWANCFVHPTVVFRSNLINRVGFYDESLPFAQDYDFWLRMSEQTRVHNMVEPLLNYRIHAGQISVGKVLQQSLCAHRANLAARRRRAGSAGQQADTRWLLDERWLEWRGRPGSLASFYLGQLDNFRSMADRRLPRQLTLAGLKSAPLSPRAWKAYIREHVLTNWRAAVSAGM